MLAFVACTRAFSLVCVRESVTDAPPNNRPEHAGMPSYEIHCVPMSRRTWDTAKIPQDLGYRKNTPPANLPKNVGMPSNPKNICDSSAS